MNAIAAAVSAALTTKQVNDYVLTFDAEGNHLTTIDIVSGLEWTANDLGKFTNAENDSDAVKACAECRIGGHDDWTLPDVRQLLTLVDYKRHSPVIDTEAFPSCDGGWFWTSTAEASSPSDCAWSVSFGNGFSYSGSRGGGGRVRAVRRASRQFLASLASGSEQATA
jgi:hypothetical protein